MKGRKLYGILSKLTPVITPVLILLHAIFLYFTYDKQEDIGGWGSLVLGVDVIIAIVWGLIMWFLVWALDFYSAYPFRREVLKWLLALSNLIIWISLGGILMINNALAIVNGICIVLMGIGIIIYKKRLCEPCGEGG